MRRLNAILCLSSAAIMFGSARGLAQSPWVPLGNFGHPALLDTSAIIRRSSNAAVVRVRLVGYTGAGYDRVETQEINCRTHQSRVLKAEEVQVGERGVSELRAPPADSAWHSYVRGSLGGQLLGALCVYVLGVSDR